MWNPATSSDNKHNIREQAEDDCKCSSGGLEQLKQQQKQTINSSKQQTSTSFPGLEESGDSEKKFLEVSEETIDSGFISGPQTSAANVESYMESESMAEIGASGEFKKLNTTESTTKEQQHNLFNLDSGILEEEFDEGVESKAVISTEESSNMILPKSVESGISEWFCNLNLNNDSNTANINTLSSRSNSRTSSSAIGTGLNNLNAPKQEKFTESETQQHSKSSIPSTTSYSKTDAQDTASIPQQITPANAWEKFYQQDDDGDTPLHLACISGYVDVVAALIRMAPHPCLFNIKNDDAHTPLHLATLTAQPKIIRMLLIAGAEPTVRDRNGNTPLHLACISGEEQCVRALTIPISASEVHEAHRQYGHRANDKSYLKCAQLPSDLEIRNYDGERCVHLAALTGLVNILRILVLYGADINAREGKAGRTPLHIAIESCNEELTNYLLEDCQKLNLETETYAGLTAYQVACISNKSEMQIILEKRGAEPLTPPDSDCDSSDNETDLSESKFRNHFGDPGYFVGFKGGNAMTVA